MVEEQSFIIYTDHKRITSAFQQKKQQCFSGQFCQLDLRNMVEEQLFTIYTDHKRITSAFQQKKQ